MQQNILVFFFDSQFQ